MVRQDRDVGHPVALSRSFRTKSEFATIACEAAGAGGEPHDSALGDRSRAGGIGGDQRTDDLAIEVGGVLAIEHGMEVEIVPLRRR